MLIENGYNIFTDQYGKPLDNGYIFIGVYGLNPISNPLQAYWDEDLTIPATNIRTSNGYPVYNGSPGRLYVNGSYSILVKDKNNVTVYTQLYAYEAPTIYGDPIISSDILLYNSTLSQSTSEGVAPTEDTVSMVETTDVKWPGRRFAVLIEAADTGLEWLFTPNTDGFSLSGEFNFSAFSQDQWCIAMHDTSTLLTTVHATSSGYLEAGVEGTDTTGTTALDADTWYHVKITVTYSGKVNVYLDGVLEIESTADISDLSAYTNVTYGGSGSLGTASKELLGMFADAHYRASVDITTTHYDTGLPWVDPDSEVSYDGSGFYDTIHGVISYRKAYTV